MLETELPSETAAIHSVKGNQPLLLDNEQGVWKVCSGSLALFSVLLDQTGELSSSRSYLFTVEAENIVLGMPPVLASGKDRVLLAVPIEETTLEACTLPEFVQSIAADLSRLELLNRWIQAWGDWIDRHPYPQETPQGEAVQAKADAYVSLLPQQILQAPRQAIVWAQIPVNSMRWLGLERVQLEDSAAVFPVTTQLWLVAQKAVEVYGINPATFEQWESLPASLVLLHRFLFQSLNQIEQQKLEAKFRQFQERESLNRQVVTSAIGELVGAVNPRRADFFEAGDPLLVAAGAVAHALGFKISPPARSEDPRQIVAPLDAIARASKFRVRRVLLTGNWWQKEEGPLLAYTRAGEPVALLLNPSKRYILFDPRTFSQTPVDQDVAQSLSVEAFMFYRPLPEALKLLGILAFAIRGHVTDIALIIGLGVLGSLLGMVVPQATTILINNAIPDADRTLLAQLGLALLVAAFGKSIFELSQGLVLERVENAANKTLQPAVWDRLLQLSPAFLRNFSTGDLLVRLMSISQIRAELSGATQRSLLTGVFALMNLALMVIYSAKLALVGIAIASVTAMITSIAGVVMLRQYRRQEELDGEINSLNVELINGIAKLRVAAAEQRAFGAWSKLLSQRARLTASLKTIDDAVAILGESLPTISSMLIFWFAIKSINPGAEGQEQQSQQVLSVGQFLAFNAAYSIFLNGLVSLSNTLTDILDVIPLWERAQPIIKGKLETDASKADPGRLTGRIDLDHVFFSYREDGPVILSDINIQVNPGEFVAIVGPSGSGKSTLLRLLLSFETPTSGNIYFDGQDLGGLDIQAVRRQMGVVLQNGRIGAGSIFENITGGAIVSLSEAWDAARMAGFAADVEQMPMGMHTIVSEGGQNLSGGQRQRLLIARAVVLKPKIIVLDEATSALDNRTQEIVTSSLNQLNASRIVIAHRLSTIEKADRIYVMEAGRIVQTGRYEELLQQDGLFTRLAARQLD